MFALFNLFMYAFDARQMGRFEHDFAVPFLTFPVYPFPSWQKGPSFLLFFLPLLSRSSFSSFLKAFPSFPVFLKGRLC